MSRHTPDDLDAEFESLGNDIVAIHRYLWQNREGFRKILKKYRKHTGSAIAITEPAVGSWLIDCGTGFPQDGSTAGLSRPIATCTARPTSCTR